jgi:hypothetical protein
VKKVNDIKKLKVDTQKQQGLELNYRLRQMNLPVVWSEINKANICDVPGGGIRIISSIEQGIELKRKWDEYRLQESSNAG